MRPLLEGHRHCVLCGRGWRGPVQHAKPVPRRVEYGPTWGDPASFPGGRRPDVIGKLIDELRAELRLRWIASEGKRRHQAAEWRDEQLTADLPPLYTFEQHRAAHVDLAAHMSS